MTTERAIELFTAWFGTLRSESRDATEKWLSNDEQGYGGVLIAQARCSTVTKRGVGAAGFQTEQVKAILAA